jgi:hypothetical protein
MKDSISSNSVWERVGKSPVAELLEDVVGAYALWHIRSSASEKFPCKPVNDSISSNSVGERVGKSPVVELLKDVIGAYALRHLRKLRLGKFSLQARERLHLL